MLKSNLRNDICRLLTKIKNDVGYYDGKTLEGGCNIISENGIRFIGVTVCGEMMLRVYNHIKRMI